MTLDAWVDFNETDRSGNVLTLRRFARSDLVVGERILIGDDEGESCEGIVTEIDQTFVMIAVQPGTSRTESAVEHATA